MKKVKGVSGTRKPVLIFSKLMFMMRLILEKVQLNVIQSNIIMVGRRAGGVFFISCPPPLLEIGLKDNCGLKFVKYKATL